MIAGFRMPELGGKRDYLDIIGANFYSTNQWQVDDGLRLQWDCVPQDPRWRPLHLLLKDVWDRYHLPLFIAETSNVGVQRPQWIERIGNEVLLTIQSGIPLSGVCLYPIIDRYDWGDAEHWHNSGLWDYHRDNTDSSPRVLNQPYAESLRMVQHRLLALNTR